MKPCILVVDGSTDGRRATIINLELRGYEVLDACSITEALVLISQNKTPDIILIDYMFAGMDGLEFFRKGRELGCDIPVVMITAADSLHLAVEFMKKGGADFILKPVTNFDVLDVMLRHVLEHTETRRQLHGAEAGRRAAEEAKALMQTFVNKMSHELVTSGYQIRAAIDFVRTALVTYDTQKAGEWLNIVGLSADRFMRLVGDMLELSRMQRGALRLEKALINLAETAEFAVKALRTNVRKDVTLSVDIPPIIVSVDADRITQVLTNLLDNAFRYTQENGTVRLSAVMLDKVIVCSVADDGIGVPPALRDTIFDEFVQGQSEHHASGKLGLGLSICREIVRLHGGTIWVDDAKPHGAAFHFALPLH